MARENEHTTTQGEVVTPASALFAFFCDKALSMTSEGMSYTPAGIVTDKYSSGCPSGKDYVVVFIDPFTLFVERQWRAEGEIEMLMVDEWQWRPLKESYERMEANAATLARAAKGVDPATD